MINFRFSGTTEILFEADTPRREITLNALELAPWSCRVRVDEGLVDCPFSLDPKKEELSISLPMELSGEIVLQVEYMGQINDKMAGFYRSRYVADGKEGLLAVTQFEESDARRAFPCLDHPLWKAVFDVEMIVPEDLVAISNGPVVEQEPVGNGKKRIRFGETPRMSTYLLFFGVGAFDFIEDKGKDVLVRAATTPGMTELARFGLDFGRKSLEFCEDYYGVKYPLPKLDLIAVADFAFGAMENWGAITFRENLLLHDPETTSRASEQRICEVIAHEMAHQWFGNLVTPSDWKYLWLNESFATYFGFGVVDHYHPDWGVWDQFLNTQTDRALYRDSLQGTFPIEIPGGEHVVINEVTAPIIYSKGGSILRQMEAYVGAEGFKKGLRHYLKKHAYECASSRHLWEALEEASGKPVTSLMKSWVEQPGHPLVEVERDGNRLGLRQKRFTFLPGKSAQLWMVPVTVRAFYENGEERVLTTLMEGGEAELDLGEGVQAYKVNAGQSGFYRVRYAEKEDLDKLGRRVAEKLLPPEDRWGLQNDLYALVQSCTAQLDDYLQLLRDYENEDAFLPLIGIAENLHHTHLVMNRGESERAAEAGKGILDKTLERIGLEPDKRENHTISQLRDRILVYAAQFGSTIAKDFGQESFARLMQGEEVHPDIQRGVMQVGALFGGSEAFKGLTRRLESSQSEHERINILWGLGSFSDRVLMEKALGYALDSVPDRNKFMLLCRVAVNPHAHSFLWDWFTSNLQRLEQLHPIHFERVIGAAVPLCGAGREDDIASFFEQYTQRTDRAKDAIQMSLERLEIHRRMRDSSS